MIDSKFILTLIGLTITVLLISNMSCPVSEAWTSSVPRTAIKQRYKVNSKTGYSISFLGKSLSIHSDKVVLLSVL